MPPTVQRQAGLPSTNDARRAFAEGDLATAERICSEVLARAPADGAAWALLTETAVQRDRLDAAMICADRAVEFMPRDPIALVLRAKVLFLSGEARSALEAAEAAAGMIDNAPETLDALGAIFGLLGLHGRAKGFFQRAVASRGDVPQYLFNLAATERMTGGLSEAEAHCNAAIKLDRQYALAHYLRSDLRIQTADQNHIAEMEALIAEGRLTPQSEVMLRFALGKECEDLDLQGRAFDHVEAGCDLHRRSLSHDHAAAIAEIERIIATQTRSWIAAALQAIRPPNRSSSPGCHAPARRWWSESSQATPR